MTYVIVVYGRPDQGRRIVVTTDQGVEVAREMAKAYVRTQEPDIDWYGSDDSMYRIDGVVSE